MKKIFFTLFVAFFAIATSAQAQPKNKFGHINSGDLLKVMPERAAAEDSLKKYYKELEAELQAMTKEYEKKKAELQAVINTLSPLVKESKLRDLQAMEDRIIEFQEIAQESVAEKEQLLLQPIIEKAKQAIKEVSTENGYTYVFDTSSGLLLHFPEGDDILSLVKAKLKIAN